MILSGWTTDRNCLSIIMRLNFGGDWSFDKTGDGIFMGFFTRMTVSFALDVLKVEKIFLRIVI